MFNEEKEKEDAAKAAAKVEQDAAASPPEAPLALADSRDAGAPPLAGMGNEGKTLKPPTPMGTMVAGGLMGHGGSSGTLVPDSLAHQVAAQQNHQVLAACLRREALAEGVVWDHLVW